MSNQSNTRAAARSLVFAADDLAMAITAVSAYLSGIRRAVPEAELRALVELGRQCYAEHDKKIAIKEIRTRMGQHGRALGSVQANEVLARCLGYDNVHQFAAGIAKKISGVPEAVTQGALPSYPGLQLRSITLRDWDKHHCVMSVTDDGAVHEVSRSRGFGEDSPTDSADLEFGDGSVLGISGSAWRFIEGTLGTEQFISDLLWLDFDDLEHLVAEMSSVDDEQATEVWGGFVAGKRAEHNVVSPASGRATAASKRR